MTIDPIKELNRRIQKAYLAGAVSFVPDSWTKIVETAISLLPKLKGSVYSEEKEFDIEQQVRRQRRDPYGVHLPADMIAVKVRHILMVEMRLAELEKELTFLKQDEESFQRLRNHLCSKQSSEAVEAVKISIQDKERAHLRLVPEILDKEDP